jgi:hypothetical protein
MIREADPGFWGLAPKKPIDQIENKTVFITLHLPIMREGDLWGSGDPEKIDLI